MEKQGKSLGKKKNKIIFGGIIILALISIGVGCYLNYLGNSKRVFANALEKLDSNLKNIIAPTKIETGIGDNYMIQSDLKIKIEDNMMQSFAAADPTYQSYINLLNNLNRTENTFQLIQNKDQKKLFLSYNSRLNSEDLFSLNYLIENATQYYYLSGLVDTYVNNGSSNFFESLDSTTNERENFIYLYNFVLESLKRNLKQEYFQKSIEETEIDGVVNKYTKISFTLNNAIAREIASNILKDLKDDAKASKILTSMNSDFPNAKIDEDAEIIDQEITLDVYTDSIMYQIKKYDIHWSDTTNNYRIQYEEESGNGNIQLNDQEEIQFKITQADTKYQIELLQKEELIGTMEIENTETDQVVSLDFSLDGYQMTGIYEAKISNVEKEKSYQMQHNLEFKIITPDQKTSRYGVTIDSVITNQSDISVDVSNSVLASSITEEQMLNYQNYWVSVINKLMS